jgi:V/A-type H+-transporting ATPase subunit F
MIITTPDQASGYQLAGVETFAVQSSSEAEHLLRTLLESDEASLIGVRQDLLLAMDPRLQRRIETSYRPVVIAIPVAAARTGAAARRRYIAELIRRAIGFHISFGAETAEERQHE